MKEAKLDFKEKLLNLGGTTVNPHVNHSSWLFVERTKERNSLFLLKKIEKLNLKVWGSKALWGDFWKVQMFAGETLQATEKQLPFGNKMIRQKCHST